MSVRNSVLRRKEAPRNQQKFSKGLPAGSTSLLEQVEGMIEFETWTQDPVRLSYGPQASTCGRTSHAIVK